MLVLSRKVGEEIVIGDNIRVRVLSVQGNQIRLGFIAPRDVGIQRQELLQGERRPARSVPQPPPAERLPVPDAIVVDTPRSEPLPA